MFALVNAVIVLIVTGVGMGLSISDGPFSYSVSYTADGTTTTGTPPSPVALLGLGIAGLSGLYGLAVLVPTVAVAVRRLHDTGRSGAWYLLNFLPFGFIVLLIFACQDSGPNNKYGPNPKALEATSSGRAAQQAI